jgi:predicted GNAT family acetyltransferase
MSEIRKVINDNSIDSEVVNNKESNRFEINIHEYSSIVPYKIEDGMITLFHTEVPIELRGLGLATKLAEYALNYAKKNDLEIVPYCPFIRSYIKEHPEWEQFVNFEKINR